ncbi:hypothetical protein Ddye_007970 [Dipteronia dyeriana]|uniref:Uncharacterized protein n=1 Tax=Dipteronia dyeriana TaxID=168575 RepID=A0AAD9X8Z9_9ROSI|nr:hypothetical protein Ddye_007970 [Dipteronia dyeriana]
MLITVLMAESASGMNKRMVMMNIEANNPSNDQQQQSKAAVMKENLDSNGAEADVTNHHNIPRPSFDGWDNNQHGPAETLVSNHD